MSSATRSSVVPPAPWVVCKRETLEDLALGEERRVHVLAGTSSAPAPAGGGGTSGFGFGVRSPLFSSGEGKKEGVQRRVRGVSRLSLGPFGRVPASPAGSYGPSLMCSILCLAVTYWQAAKTARSR